MRTGTTAALLILAIEGCAQGVSSQDVSSSAMSLAPISALGTPPAPSFVHLRFRQTELAHPLYFEDLTISPIGQSGALTVFKPSGTVKFGNQCDRSFGGEAMDFGGLINGAWHLKYSSCGSSETAKMSATAVSDVTGQIFPLMVGNEASFKLTYGEGQFASVRQMRMEVTAHQDHYKLSDGRDVGEVYLIRSGTIDPTTGAWTSVTEYTYSTKLNWEINALSNGGQKEEIVSWD